jgi:hypothetical protein
VNDFERDVGGCCSRCHGRVCRTFAGLGPVLAGELLPGQILQPRMTQWRRARASRTLMPFWLRPFEPIPCRYGGHLRRFGDKGFAPYSLANAGYCAFSFESKIKLIHPWERSRIQGTTYILTSVFLTRNQLKIRRDSNLFDLAMADSNFRLR